MLCSGYVLILLFHRDSLYTNDLPSCLLSVDCVHQELNQNKIPGQGMKSLVWRAEFCRRPLCGMKAAWQPNEQGSFPTERCEEEKTAIAN